MAEGLAVGGERVQGGWIGLVRHGVGPADPVVEQVPEGDGVRQRPVVDEERDLPTAAGDVARGASVRGDGIDLVRGEHGEADALRGERVEGGVVDGGLGQPHALGLAAEARAEVGDAPTDLGEAVAGGGEREDGVVVGHGERVAVPAEPGAAAPVRVEDGPVRLGGVALHPAQERGAEVEADPLQRVDAPLRPVLVGEHASGDDGGVALRGDPLVPVVEGSGRGLEGHAARPRILPGRLIEVPVKDDRARRGARGGGEGAPVAGARKVGRAQVRELRGGPATSPGGGRGLPGTGRRTSRRTRPTRSPWPWPPSCDGSRPPGRGRARAPDGWLAPGPRS